jgi:hypothetical protein
MIVLTLLLLCTAPTWAQADTQEAEEAPRVRVRATGQAPADLPNAREAAVEDALRRCVEAGGGVELSSVSKSADYMLVSDVIYTKTAGYIQTYKVLQENPDQDGLFTVRVEAVVSKGDINADIQAFKALVERKGRPRLVVVGAVDDEPFDLRLTAEVDKKLKGRGIRVVDARRLSKLDRQAAERAARADEDPKRAALIAQQLNADVLVVVDVVNEAQPKQEVYGVEQHPVTSVGVVRMIRADTADVLGSDAIEQQTTGTTAASALRKGASLVVGQALDSAIEQVALYWLEEIDQRGGQEVVILMQKFSFKRSTNLIAKLRKIDGVKDVIVDRTDADATGQLRIITNSTAADVASILSKLDASLTVVSTSGNKIEVK